MIAVAIPVVALLVFLIVMFCRRDGSTDRSARFKDYHDLRKAAESRGFYVTHDIDGVHNANSLHYSGHAIDVRTWDHTSQQVDAFITQMRELGLTVFDERTRPAHQAQWDGAHIHVQIPQPTRGTRQISLFTTRAKV